MNLPDKCPFCGAGVALNYAGRKQISDVRVVYECQTVIVDAHDRQRWQSDRCENAQKARAVDCVRELAARVAELEARCKRLEDAARAVYIDSIASDHPWTELETLNMHSLRDVLEAKPCALREKMEAKPAEKAAPCPYCLRVECECSDFDVSPDMGDK